MEPLLKEDKQEHYEMMVKQNIGIQKNMIEHLKHKDHHNIMLKAYKF